MNKRKNFKEILVSLLDNYLIKNEEDTIVEYLISNSNLPGPRGNLELANELVEVITGYPIEDVERLWDLFLRLGKISSDEVAVNDPREFLSFCGVYVIGTIGSNNSEFFERSLIVLREVANDTRWRMREAASKGLQKLLVKHGQDTFRELNGWIGEDNWLEMRAVAAGIAEPSLLKDGQIAVKALELHKKILAKVITSRERKSEEFKTLRKGLGYTLSVVIQAIPEEGFKYLRRLADPKDKDIQWIIRNNLKKTRLTKNFSIEVQSINELLR